MPCSFDGFSSQVSDRLDRAVCVALVVEDSLLFGTCANFCVQLWHYRDLLLRYDASM